MRSWFSNNVNKDERQKEREAIHRLEMEGADEEDVLLFAEAQLGIIVNEFWESDAGKYLRGRCKHIMSEASQQLIKENPYDTEKVALLQREARACQLLVKMVNDAITNGDASSEELQRRYDDGERSYE